MTTHPAWRLASACFCVCLVLLLPLSHWHAGAQSTNTPQAAPSSLNRSLPAVRLTTAPTIDGDLSDPCWQEAAKAERFVDWINDNAEIDQTIVYVGYDDKNLYLGWYCKDSQPKQIVARQFKRGAFPQGDDWVDLNLDTFHTHKYSDYSFFYVNPRGAQYAQLGGGRATKLEWEGAWKSAAKIVSDGWTAEMAIPWAMLNYPGVKGPTTCGINFLRFHKRANMISNWSNIGPNDLHPEFAGHLEGIVFPPFRSQVSLLPYALAGWSEKTGFSLRAGLDVRSTLTPGLTGVGTINPDFATVEGAVEGIDFSYGERFVPERRPFFLEGRTIYNSGGLVGRYFYSLRIPGFDIGTNIYGKVTPRDSIGALAALNIGDRADWILRGRHEFGPTSSVDMAFINRDGKQTDEPDAPTGSNRVLVLGENFRKGLWSIDSSGALSFVNGQRTGSTANVFFTFQDPQWFASIAPYYVSPGFKNELGFFPFLDYKGVNAQAGYFKEWRKGALRFLSMSASYDHTDHFDGTIFRRQKGVSFGFQTRSDYDFQVGWDGGRFEEFDDSVFRVNLRMRASDPFRNFGIGYSWGHQAGAPITFITPFITWRFGERLTLGLTSSLLSHKDDPPFQHILTFNYDFSASRSLVGRIVAQQEGTNGYIAYRQSGYGGVETFLMLGDPNATTFQLQVQFKVVWPL